VIVWTEPVVELLGLIFITALAIGYLRTRFWTCPDCGIGNGTDRLLDYAHIAASIEENPYCPYCGTQTRMAGRRYQYWLHRLTGRKLIHE